MSTRRTQPVGQRRGTKATFVSTSTGTVHGRARDAVLERILSDEPLRRDIAERTVVRVRVRGRVRDMAVRDLLNVDTTTLEEVRRPAAWARRRTPSELVVQPAGEDSDSYHVWAESALEVASLDVVAADRRLRAAVTQALYLEWEVTGAVVGHFPDFLIDQVGDPPLLVDCRPAERRNELRFQAQVALTAAVASHLGWCYELWDWPPAQVARNLQDLAFFDEVSEAVDRAAVHIARLRGHRYDTAAGFLRTASCETPDLNRVSVLKRALWTGRVSVNLAEPITGWTALCPGDGADGLLLDGPWRERLVS